VRDAGDVSLLISSHLLRDVDETCDEVLILKNGHIAAICNLEEERRANRRFIELETVAAQEAFGEAIRQLGCECASFPGERWKLVMPESVQIRDLYTIAAKQGVQIRRMNYRRDSLEDIFLGAMNSKLGVARVGA